MSLALLALGAIATAVFVEEVIGWVHPTCRFILRRGARRLPGAWSGRYAEEWERDLLDLPGGPLTRIAWTIRTRLGARALNAELAPDHMGPANVSVQGIGPTRTKSDGLMAAQELLDASSTDAAVLLAFQAIEAHLHVLLLRRGISLRRGHTHGQRLAEVAASHGLLATQTLRDIKVLAAIRNGIAHPRRHLDPQRVNGADASELAADYLDRAETVLDAIVA